METNIFDRETILDLVVNFIPLGIILFFIATFAVVSPWGFELRTSGVMFAIMGVMFVALAVLTYFSAKAIAGDEKSATVYAQGQAGLRGAKPLHEAEEAHSEETPAAGSDDGEEDSEAGGDTDETVDDTTEAVDDADEADGDDSETSDDSDETSDDSDDAEVADDDTETTDNDAAESAGDNDAEDATDDDSKPDET